MARPKTEFPMQVVEAACQFNATVEQVLEVLAGQGYKVSRTTLYRGIKRAHGVSFETLREQKTEGTKLKLVQKAVTMGLAGNPTMLIFCLKALCGWKETTKHEVTGKDGSPLLPKEALPTPQEAAAILAGDYATQAAPSAKVEDL